MNRTELHKLMSCPVCGAGPDLLMSNCYKCLGRTLDTERRLGGYQPRPSTDNRKNPPREE